MAERISVIAADGHTFDAWHANPTGTAKGGVIFLQAIYGLTDHLGDVCDWFAGDGFAAVAPATYDRTERNKVFAYDDHGGMQFREHLGEDTVLLDIGGCATLLRQNTDKIAIARLLHRQCLGLDSSRSPRHGRRCHLLRQRHSRQPWPAACPAILHYGDADHVVAFEQVQKIQTTYPDNDFTFAGAGHAFYNPEQAHHDPEAAKLAHQRSVEFLEKHFA